MSVLFVLVSESQSVPSTKIYPSGRDWLVAPSLVIPSLSLEMLHALFHLPPSGNNCLLLEISEVSLVVLDVGHSEPFCPPLTDRSSFELPVVWWWTLLWVIFQLARSINNVVVGQCSKNWKETNSNEVEVANILDSIDDKLRWSLSEYGSMGCSSDWH